MVTTSDNVPKGAALHDCRAATLVDVVDSCPGLLQRLAARHGAIRRSNNDGGLALNLPRRAARLVSWMGAAAVDAARVLRGARSFHMAATAAKAVFSYEQGAVAWSM